MKQLILFLIILCSFINSSYSQIDPELLAKLESIEKDLDTLKNEKRDKQFVFSLGGNLDFLEKTQINGAYYDVGVCLLKLSDKKKSTWNRIGIQGRLTQGRFAVGKDSIYIENRPFILERLEDDNIRILDQGYTNKSEETRNYLNLSASTIFNPYTDKEVFYFALHVELQRVGRIFNTERLVTKQDTLITLFNENVNYTKAPIENLNRNFETVNYNILLTVGPKIFIDRKNIDFDLSAHLGMGRAYNRGSWEWNPFYLTHFEIHYKGSGSFKVGGEVRGYFQGAPSVTTYIAKTFSFKALGALFGS